MVSICVVGDHSGGAFCWCSLRGGGNDGDFARVLSGLFFLWWTGSSLISSQREENASVAFTTVNATGSLVIVMLAVRQCVV